MNTAVTILNQLGGNKFIAMTGSKNLMNTGNGLQMNLSKNNAKAKFLSIELTEMDLYRMTFYSLNKEYQIETKKEVSGVYADQLNSIFEEVTGLITKF